MDDINKLVVNLISSSVVAENTLRINRGMMTLSELQKRLDAISMSMAEMIIKKATFR